MHFGLNEKNADSKGRNDVNKVIVINRVCFSLKRNDSKRASRLLKTLN